MQLLILQWPVLKLLFGKDRKNASIYNFNLSFFGLDPKICCHRNVFLETIHLNSNFDEIEYSNNK